jgi:hypothetical protein
MPMLAVLTFTPMPSYVVEALRMILEAMIGVSVLLEAVGILVEAACKNSCRGQESIL